MMPPMRPLDHNTAGCDARLKLLKLPDTRPDPFLHRRRAVMLRKLISGKSAIDASYSHFSRLDQRVGRFIDPDQDWRRGRFAADHPKRPGFAPVGRSAWCAVGCLASRSKPSTSRCRWPRLPGSRSDCSDDLARIAARARAVRGICPPPSPYAPSITSLSGTRRLLGFAVLTMILRNGLPQSRWPGWGGAGSNGRQ